MQIKQLWFPFSAAKALRVFKIMIIIMTILDNLSAEQSRFNCLLGILALLSH